MTRHMILAVSLACVATGVLGAAAVDGTADPEAIDPVHSLAGRINALGINILHAVTEDGENALICPLSIYEALAALQAGARGETAAELRRAMGGEDGDPTAGLGVLREQIVEDREPERPTVESANSVWVQAGMAVKPAYAQCLAQDYASELLRADFARQAEAARLAINAWVAERTHDMIRELFAASALSPLTRLIVCNAIYLRARWADPFDPGLTRPWRFWLTPDESARVPFMRQVAVLPYLEEPDCTIAELPYVGGELSMLVIVPSERDGLRRVESGLTVTRLGEWFRGLADRKICVLLPKMQIRSMVRLGGCLEQMGVRSVFQPATADLTGVSDEKPLYLERVLHVVAVDVNEEGTEAAAVTAGVVVSGGAKLPAVVADRPFLFIIRHRPTDTVLFLGRVVDPRGQATG